MSHTRVKSTFEQQGNYSGTDVVEIFCHHNHSNDITSFMYADGDTVEMTFQSWSIERQDKWDVIQKLWYPFIGEWGRSKLKEGVSYWTKEDKERIKY